MTTRAASGRTQPGSASKGQLTKLAILYGEAGYSDRADRVRHAGQCVGRELASSSELSFVEAHGLIESLERVAAERHRLEREAAPAPEPAAVPAPRPPAEDVPLEGVLIKRYGPGCHGDPARGLHFVPAGEGTRFCACGTVARIPPAKDRSCPPAVCYCGACPYWKPPPPVNYAAAIAKLREEASGGRGRGRR